MGSHASAVDESSNEVNVFVTGFGAGTLHSQLLSQPLTKPWQPFLDCKKNPSFLIASSLPSSHKALNLPLINIHVHPQPVKVAYKFVRENIPKLLFTEPSLNEKSHDAGTLAEQAQAKPLYDIVLHIGMASGCNYYTLETLAHRNDYTKKDVDGETMEGDVLWQWEYGSPEILHTSFDTEDVWRRWKSTLTDEDVRPSNDPGRYVCDFIYYTSLVEYWRRDHKSIRPVMFLHVPGKSEDEDVARGKKVALGLIEALVASRQRT